MIGVALLVFREVLEAALIISIVTAATRGVPRREWFVFGGVALGIAGAFLVALSADFIASLAGGGGQDLFNAGVLLIAVLMIGWHVTWMSSHSREMAQQMKAVGGSVQQGQRSLTVLLSVVALAVLREGSEVVLFLYGMAVGGVGTASLVGGILLGVGSGGVLGFILYRGLLRVPLKYFFSVTNIMLMVLAAGLASTAAGYLVQSDLLPAWGTPLWDTSRLLSDESFIGKSLGVLAGYKARPEGIQVLVYLGILGTMLIGARITRRHA